MKRRVLIIFIFVALSLFITTSFAFAGSSIPKLKLPYPKGEKRIVSQGYNCDGWKSPWCTHKGKDRYAIDFNLPGEQDYGKKVLASANGTTKLKEGWCKNKNGKYFLCGYGRYIDNNHNGGYITRYAHLKKFAVKNGKEVKQGEVIGYADNTGSSTGTHLHFALYEKSVYEKKGKKYIEYIGVKPEPMSGYTNFKAGKWYKSDNEIVSGEVKGAKIEKEIWNQKFVSYKLTKINNQVYKVTLNFKNTGNTTWTKDIVSLNVIGGYGGTAAKFYHQSWLTRLRPAFLYKNTAPGKIGAFIFYIQLPKTPGKYYPQFRPVRYLGGSSFEWIGTDVGTFPIVIKKEIIPKPTCSISANPSSITKGNYSILKWNSTNATSVSITNVGSVALSGSKKVYPLLNTTYKMTAKGKGGTAICSVKVKVNVPPPPPSPPPEVKNIWYVPDDYQTIQAAIDALEVNPGNTIIVKDGTYIENVDASKSLTIRSENGPDFTTVQAANLNDCTLEITVDYANIIGFTVTGATEGFGICLENANYCNIFDNDISNNNTGIYLHESDKNALTKNDISAINIGILLDHSHNNILTKNNIDPVLYENSLILGSSSNNEIYLNNIDKKVECFDSTDNTWNSPKEMDYIYNGKRYTNHLGNHWSDYQGSDIDGDGIGDTPYTINENNIDNYPLIRPLEYYELK